MKQVHRFHEFFYEIPKIDLGACKRGMDKSPVRHKHSDIQPTQNMEGALTLAVVVVVDKELLERIQPSFDVAFNSESFMEYLKFLREMLLSRLPVHFGTDKSKTAEKIQFFSELFDQLKIHVSSQKLSLFLNVLGTAFNTGLDIRKCILAQRNEDKNFIEQYRDMVCEIWKRFLLKTKALMKSIMEKTPDRNRTPEVSGKFKEYLEM